MRGASEGVGGEDGFLQRRVADMLDRSDASREARFAAYVEALTGVIGHADRAGPLRDYCTGLLLPGERKSVEPLAALTAPARLPAQHQSLLHFIGQAAWSDERVLAKTRDLVLPWIEGSGPIEAWIIDDTGFPKKGRHSVGVARQYCGQLGKQDNCQVAVTLSIANHAASLPVAYRLYLPREWAEDAARRRKAGVPAEVAFQTKPEIALRQIAEAIAAGLPPGVVLMDAGYGNDTALRSGVGALGLSYVAGILSNTSVWGPGSGPLPAQPWSGRGRPPKRMRRDALHQPISVKALALGLEPDAWQAITWREGANAPLTSRFARLRVRAAHSEHKLTEPRPQEWLLVEWPKARTSPANTGSRPCPRTLRSIAWSTRPCSDGASSATTRNSSRSLGSATSKAAAGAASITTPPCASPPTPSSSPSGRGFPPQDQPPPQSAKNLPYPKATDPEALPIRPERHVTNSIATLRRRLAVALARNLPRCPCCAIRNQTPPHY